MLNRVFPARTGAILGLAMAAGLAAAAPSQDRPAPVLAIGVLAHDQGPFSDHNEDGVDLNLEAQFAPLDFPGSPRPHLGATANFDGETSAAYGGLSFRLHESSRWYADAFLGVALHDGPLHKDPTRCDLYSDCGFGSRLLPRLGGEIGYRIRQGASLSLFLDHMSHKWVIGGENEGLDHIGLRYIWPY
jgi:hypothetical protein